MKLINKNRRMFEKKLFMNESDLVKMITEHDQ